VGVLGRLAVDDLEEALQLGHRATLAAADDAAIESRIGVTSAAVPVKKASSAM
jgi:hypothetical protein